MIFSRVIGVNVKINISFRLVESQAQYVLRSQMSTALSRMRPTWIVVAAADIDFLNLQSSTLQALSLQLLYRLFVTSSRHRLQF